MAVNKLMKKLVYIITLLLLITGYSKAQMVIKGKVMASDDGLPLHFVSIQAKETDKKTLTTIDGNFEIQVELGQTLIFRFVGFVEREVQITEDKFYLIELKPYIIQDDFGQNRIHFDAGYDLKNRFVIGKLSYVSNQIGWFSIRASVVKNLTSHADFLDSKIEASNLIYSYPNISIGTTFRYQNISFQEYSFKNSTFSFQPKLKYFDGNIGFGVSNHDLNPKKTFGILLGARKEIQVGTYHYIPLEVSSTFWGKNVEFNASLKYRVLGYFELGLSYQHYRSFDSLIATVGSSIRLWKRAKNEY
tara:strand:+ start:105140 stop:106048 length:909 start_codon:yes stop_codon:yes gene_type:complete